jgi:hypothetical protein
MHFIYQLASGVGWVWVNLLRPVLRPASRGLMAVIRGYRRLWDRHTRGRDGRFSTTRAGVVLTATAVFLFILPGLLGFGLDLSLFAATVSQETGLAHPIAGDLSGGRRPLRQGLRES